MSHLSIRTALFACLVFIAGCDHLPAKDAAPAVRADVESRVTEVKALAAIPAALAESGARRTLLVLDIDDTLLTSATFFGSDAWYEWQKHLADGDPGKVPCRFDVIALNYEAGTQVATEGAAGPDLVNGLPGDRLILTARNPNYRGGTIRELKQAGYVLPAMLGADPEGTFFRWQDDKPGARPVVISYQDGVMMVSGGNKGKTLLALLAHLKLRYERVVLVDDGKANIDAMQAALREAGIDYHGLWYTRIDKTLSAEDERAGRAGWAAMRAWVGTVFPERLKRMEAGVCQY
jgi:hypothetical protein